MENKVEQNKKPIQSENPLNALEQDIIIRSEYLNFPALVAHFQLTEAEIISALAKKTK